MTTDVTREGLVGERPGRRATTGVNAGRRRRDQAMVPEATPTSYYGQPVLNGPVWEARDIAGYLFLGGLAGGSSALALAARLTGDDATARVATTGAALAGGLSLAALIHDLGRPARFLHMLRVFKPSSPMSVGSWLLAGYVPAAGAAAVVEWTGVGAPLGAASALVAGVLGPAVASYTGALIADTAVPAWHDGHRELPLIFAASGGSAAAGLALALGGDDDLRPLRRLAVACTGAEVALTRRVRSRLEPEVDRAYDSAKAGPLMRAAEALGVAGAVTAAIAGRSRRASRAAGVALVAASACLRFGIFHAGVASAADPEATTAPQRRRREADG